MSCSDKSIVSEIGRSAPLNPAAMIRTLVSVAAVSGILIVLTFEITKPIIKKNKAEALKKAVFEVLPGTKKIVPFKVLKDGGLKKLPSADSPGEKYFAGYDGKGALTGVAVEAAGQGFQDIVKVLYGYSPIKKGITGMTVLESKETPGLGDKAGSDPDFLANIKDLDVSLDSGGTTLAHPITVVKKDKKKAKWELAAITGATITSKAVGRMLKESTLKSIPGIEKNLDYLRKEGGR